MPRRLLIAVLALMVAVVGVLGWRVASTQRSLDRARSQAVSAERELGRIERALRASRENADRLTHRLGAATRMNTRLSHRLDAVSCFQSPNSTVRSYARGPLRGDVDGDGLPDRVLTVGMRLGASPCRYRLLVATHHGRFSAPIASNAPDSAVDLRMFLAPAKLVPLNDTPGDEIVVTFGSGASTEWGGVFTLISGRLVQMDIQGSPDDTFGWAGSVGVGEAVDCVPENYHTVVSSGYEYARSSSRFYDVRQTFYRVEGASFVHLQTLHLRVRGDRGVQRLGLYQDSPFPSCGVGL